VVIFIRLAAILLLILLFVLYLKGGRFTLAKRFIVGVLILLLIGIIVFYEISYTKRSNIDREILNAFNQNKTLVCEGHEVTSDDFTFVGGTKVFTHKNSRGQAIVSIENCEIK
jgi:Ca2+/Na+ antiporter